MSKRSKKKSITRHEEANCSTTETMRRYDQQTEKLGPSQRNSTGS
jgi:hypothetical protein